MKYLGRVNLRKLLCQQLSQNMQLAVESGAAGRLKYSFFYMGKEDHRWNLSPLKSSSFCISNFGRQQPSCDN